MTSRLLSTLAACQLLFTLPSMAVDIIAHRGASFNAPENTVAAMNVAWKLNTDACELDTHMSQDGLFVLCHDFTLKKTTGVDKKVTETTWAEMKELDAGAWKDAKWKGEKLPSLQQALATIPAGKTMYVEVKLKEQDTPHPNLIPNLIKEFKASGKTPEQLTIIAFNYEVCKQAKKLAPEYPVYFLASNAIHKETQKPKWSLDQLIQMAKDANLNGLDLRHDFPIDHDFVAKIHEAGLKLCIWTVNEPEMAKSLAKAGVDSITTDRPDLIRDAIGSR